MPNPIAFSIFGIDIRWYGVLIATGMILAAVITYVRAPRHGIERENILDIVLVSIPVGIIGARAYYVIFSWDYYGAHPDQILNFRGGGLAIHGGLIFGLLAAWFVCRHKKISFINALDLALPTVALAQAIGRWGNYFNGEAHGGPTNLPWAITVDGIKVHPTFLYESIWCIIIFAVLILIDNKSHFAGKIACLYGILYSAERFCVEALRTDSLMIGPFKQAQVLSTVVILLCLAAYIYLKKKNVVLNR
ncbi:MAG TPA: prolipoprotein diacylglyceryl transferase [Candidatus Eubacterium pullicola]|nr:prolipoprotein diacylglyceryl transferase [Candidatus Eubacterium pullicola]